jgi:hypothetical protein
MSESNPGSVSKTTRVLGWVDVLLFCRVRMIRRQQRQQRSRGRRRGVSSQWREAQSWFSLIDVKRLSAEDVLLSIPKDTVQKDETWICVVLENVHLRGVFGRRSVHSRNLPRPMTSDLKINVRNGLARPHVHLFETRLQPRRGSNFHHSLGGDNI